MPTYEYKCDQCGPFELWQSIKDDALSKCPKCGARVERLISAGTGFILKGSGFYQNDSKNVPPAPTCCSDAKPKDEKVAPPCETGGGCCGGKCGAS